MPSSVVNLFLDSASKLTSGQITYILKYVVYPECSKKPATIVMADTLENNLGYEGNAKRLLVPKTNKAFGLKPPNRVSGSEIDELTTVSDHHALVSAKLFAAGRIII